MRWNNQIFAIKFIDFNEFILLRAFYHVSLLLKLRIVWASKKKITPLNNMNEDDDLTYPLSR